MQKARKIQAIGKDFLKRTRHPSFILRQAIGSNEVDPMTPQAFALHRRKDGSIDMEFYSRRATALRSAEIRWRAADLWRWLVAASRLTVSSSAQVTASETAYRPKAGTPRR